MSNKETDISNDERGSSSEHVPSNNSLNGNDPDNSKNTNNAHIVDLTDQPDVQKRNATCKELFRKNMQYLSFCFFS